MNQPFWKSDASTPLHLLCEKLYQGDVFLNAPHQSDSLATRLRHAISLEFGMPWESLRQLHHQYSPRGVWPHLQRLRALLGNEEWSCFFSKWLSDRLGVEGQGEYGFRFTTPSLRIFLPMGHQEPATQASYSLHRDTWYGLPGCIVNLWMPLHDLQSSESFEIYSDWFDKPIENSSHLFNQNSWEKIPHLAHYPTALLNKNKGSTLKVEGFSDTLFLFSGQHLHQSCKNEGEFTRFSLDFRLINLNHEKSGVGAKMQDNHSNS